MKKLVGLVVAIILVCTVLVGCYPRPSEDYSWLFDSSQEESSREESSKKSSETRRTFAFTLDTFKDIFNALLPSSETPLSEFEITRGDEDSTDLYFVSIDDNLDMGFNCDSVTGKIAMVLFTLDCNNAVWEDYKWYLTLTTSILDSKSAYDILDKEFDFSSKEERDGFISGSDGTVTYLFSSDAELGTLAMAKIR